MWLLGEQHAVKTVETVSRFVEQMCQLEARLTSVIHGEQIKGYRLYSIMLTPCRLQLQSTIPTFSHVHAFYDRIIWLSLWHTFKNYCEQRATLLDSYRLLLILHVAAGQNVYTITWRSFYLIKLSREIGSSTHWALQGYRKNGRDLKPL